jgi:hypothetical protein
MAIIAGLAYGYIHGQSAGYIFIHALENSPLAAATVVPVIEPYLAVPMALSEIVLSVWLVYGAMRSEKD